MKAYVLAQQTMAPPVAGDPKFILEAWGTRLALAQHYRVGVVGSPLPPDPVSVIATVHPRQLRQLAWDLCELAEIQERRERGE